MGQVQKGVQDTLERHKERTAILQDILHCRGQGRKEDKTTPVIESYTKMLANLVSKKKAKLEGEGGQKEESPSEADA